ncbi:MAG: NAD(P)H-dependent oxidoreductase [Fulvivirga sp.]
MPNTIAILYGSVRPARKGILAANYIKKQVEARGHKVHFIDPMEHKLPLLEKMYKEYSEGQAPDYLEKIASMLKEADGFIIVTGEYNHSIPPALKNLLDHFQKEYFFKPSAIASYSAGRFGGVRAAVHVRAILGELGMPSIPTMQSYPKVQSAFDDNNEPTEEYTEKSTNKFLDEFDWYVEALKTQRAKGKPY